MSDQRVIFIVFAGRECNMEVARPFFDRLLRDYPRAELHLWDLTRQESDHAYVQSRHDPENRTFVFSDLWPGDNTWPANLCRKRLRRPRRCECRDCRPAPYEKVYHWYAERPEYADAVLCKTDDDVLFFETDRFGDVLESLAEHPNAVVSANVINNVVSAKHSPHLRGLIAERFNPESQRGWFDLHALPEFATLCHDWFLFGWRDLTAPSPREIVRTVPGERISINFIAFTYPTLQRMSAAMRNNAFKRIGDEGTVDQNFLPRIVRSFTVCHLQFGPQRVGLPEETWDEYRRRYAEVRDEYLG